MKKNQKPRGQDTGNYPVRKAKTKKNKNERQRPTEIMGHDDKKRYLHFGNYRKRRERDSKSIFNAAVAEIFPKLER